MKKIVNLFPVLFALAGISFVVSGIADGADPEQAALRSNSAVNELQTEFSSQADEG